MNFEESVTKACEEPSLTKALAYICVWECERAIDQAKNRPGTGAHGEWDTCFELCIDSVMKKYIGYVYSQPCDLDKCPGCENCRDL